MMLMLICTNLWRSEIARLVVEVLWEIFVIVVGVFFVLFFHRCRCFVTASGVLYHVRFFFFTAVHVFPIAIGVFTLLSLFFLFLPVFSWLYGWRRCSCVCPPPQHLYRFFAENVLFLLDVSIYSCGQYRTQCQKKKYALTMVTCLFSTPSSLEKIWCDVVNRYHKQAQLYSSISI